MPTSALPRGASQDFVSKIESSYGSAPSGNWTRVPIYSHSLAIKAPPEDDDLLNLTRNNDFDVQALGPGLSEGAGDIVHPLCYTNVGLILKRALGAASVSGSGDPYTHTFTSAEAVIPHFHFEQKLLTSVYQLYGGLISTGFSIDISRAPGYDKVTEHCLFKSQTKGTSTAGGTAATLGSVVQAPKSLPIFKVNSTQVANVLSLKATYFNGIDTLNYIGSASPAGHDRDKRSTFKGSIELRYLDATYSDLADAGTALTTPEILWSTSSDRSLSIKPTVMKLERAGHPVDGPGGLRQNFNFWSEQNSSAAMLTVVLKSLVAAY